MRFAIRGLVLVAVVAVSSFSPPPRPAPSPAPTSSRSTSACCRRSKKFPPSITTPTPASPTIPTSTPWPRRPNASEALRTRDDNPELAVAAKALFGYPYTDLSPEHAKWLLDKKTELKKQLAGTAYFNSILDKLNIESSVANRAMMPDYLDPNVFPGSSSPIRSCGRSTTSARPRAIPTKASTFRCRKKCCTAGCSRKMSAKLPASFADYLKFISQVLEDNSKRGGIAMKFEVAYFRPTTFGDPSRAQAEEFTSATSRGGIPSEKEYRTFQDYIFRYLVTEGGRLHLPVHIHTAVGIGDYFNLSQSNIMNLESVLRDPRYASTTFVMIHGGYPLEREAIWLAAMKNVYLDSSFGELAQYPSAFKDTLKMWLETFPDKITFGTDCFPYNQVLGAEESYWLGVQSSRTALAAALAEMVSENEITEARALELAHAYLHDTAVKLYEGRVH